jgi:hypothetical protein
MLLPRVYEENPALFHKATLGEEGKPDRKGYPELFEQSDRR